MHNDAAIRPGGGALGAVDRAMHAIEKFTALISGFGIFGLMLIGVVHIFGRKLFNAPIFGYIDIVEIAMSALVFLGLAYTERLGGHIRMELFVSFLKGRWLWTFELLGVLVGLAIVAVLTYYSYTHAMRAYNSGDTHDRCAVSAVAVQDDRFGLPGAAVPAAAGEPVGLCAAAGRPDGRAGRRARTHRRRGAGAARRGDGGHRRRPHA